MLTNGDGDRKVRRALLLEPSEAFIDSVGRNLWCFIEISIKYLYPAMAMLVLVAFMIAVGVGMSVAPTDLVLAELFMAAAMSGIAFHEWLHCLVGKRLLGKQCVVAIYLIPCEARMKVTMREAERSIERLAILWAGPLGTILLGAAVFLLIIYMQWSFAVRIGWLAAMMPQILALIPGYYDNDGTAIWKILKEQASVSGRWRLNFRAMELMLVCLFSRSQGSHSRRDDGSEGKWKEKF